MKLRRCMAFLLCAAMMATVLGSCGETSGESESSSSQTQSSSVEASSTSSEEDDSSDVPDYMNPVGEYPITKELTTYTALVLADPGQPDDWNDLLVFQRLEEMTNIHIEWQQETAEAYETKMGLKLASNEYPDIFMRGLGPSSGDTYGPTGQFIALNDLIEQYMPNLKLLFENEPIVQAATTSTDGNIYTLPYYYPSSGNVPTTSFFNEQWMKNVGIDKVPETTDEFYELLVAFKEKDANGNGDPNDEIPYTATGARQVGYFLAPAFTGYAGYYQSWWWDLDENGTVVFVPEQPGFKEYLEFAHKMYEEGLLDPEFATQTSDQRNAKAKSNLVGFYNCSPTTLNGTEMETRGENQICLPPLTSPTNSKKVLPKPIDLITYAGAVSNKCENVEALMRWFDMMYADEDHAVDGFFGKVMMLGYEGEHWQWCDDTKTKYEFISPITNSSDLNKSVVVTSNLPGFVDISTVYQASNLYMEQKVSEAIEKQVPYYVDVYPNTMVKYTEEENEIISLYGTDLDTYQLMMETKFITGEESLDNFDEYLASLETYKISEIRAARQAAYDRFMAATK